ncbi:MAG: helix-turn-helix domain-containing protein [Cytophagaceae bacterium]|jgi:transcriptional regulator with XRE-family HTH domain|nr:helix-turn-helix domain-containing protein [Cytophagaceae bacterium]
MGIPVSERIEMILKHFNLNQKQLARLSNLPENTLSNAKKGKNIPNLDFFNSIYKALPVLSPHWLFMGEGTMLADSTSVPQEQDVVKKMEEMRKEIDYLREQIRDKEEIINLLKSK